MRFILAVLLVASIGLAQAQTAYHWVDQNGKVHMSDRPPPPATGRVVQEKILAAPAADKTASFALRDAASKHPVTLYVGEPCGSDCQTARDLLTKRGVPFTEKALLTDDDVAELKNLLGTTEAMVPSLQVGTRTTRGFLDSDWNNLLDAAGYPKAAGR